MVDQAGNPVAPTTNPNGTPHNGILRYASVFGPLANAPTRPDCSDAVVQGAAWDPQRSRWITGYVKKVLGVMPAVNNWEIGEGLNTAGSRWVKSTRGGQNRFGFGAADVRKQLNVKLDHNFNAKNKISGTWSFEKVKADYATRVWPTGYDGISHRQPQVLTINFTSTLSPSLIDEARWGMRRTGTNTQHGLANPATSEEALGFIPAVAGIPVLPQLGMNPVPHPDYLRVRRAAQLKLGNRNAVQRQYFGKLPALHLRRYRDVDERKTHFQRWRRTPFCQFAIWRRRRWQQLERLCARLRR